MKTETIETAPPNLDPITGAPRAHPAGTGAAVGGLAGKTVATSVDPTAEDKYWRVACEKAAYVGDSPYETYQPAYRVGFENYTAYPGKTFEEVEPELQTKYEKAGYAVGLEWAAARDAARDAWKRLEDRFGVKTNKSR